MPFKAVGTDGQVTYSTIGVQTTPASVTDPVPAVSKYAVLALLASGKLAPQDVGSLTPDSVSLVDYLSTKADGSQGKPVMAWAIEYDNVSRVISHPANYNGPSGPTPGWTTMIFVDASSGTLVDSFDFT